MNSSRMSGSMDSTCRRGRDPAPQVRAAGQASHPDSGIFYPDNRPETPESVKPFRKSATTTIGRTIHHFGTRNDAPADENIRYGRRGNYDYTAEECLRPIVVDKMGALAAEHAEKRYLSSKREPLGKTPDCPFPVPDKLNRNGFGMPTRNSENAKHVIYACGDREAPELHPAGAQRDRKYHWADAGIDPTKHRFGMTSTIDNKDGTKSLIAPQQTDTVLLPKIIKDVQTLTQHEVGKSRCLGLGVPTVVDGSVAPAGRTAKNDGASVRSLLSGHGTGDDSAYERSIGQIGCRSATLRKLKADDKNTSIANGTFDKHRSFGAPTVREDLPRPLFRKVTNSTNYGDDVGAGALIYPNRYVVKGIDEKYFTAALDLDGIRRVADECKFGLTDKEITAVFNACQQGGVTSVETFKDACYDMGL